MRSVEHLLPSFLGRQRWFAGSEPDKVVVLDEEDVVDGLHWALVDADGCRYQVVVGFRPAHHPPEFLHGHEDAVLGNVDDMLAFDATLDPDYAKALLGRLLPDEHVHHVRPMGVEQSNTSLVFDDRLVLKLFRRLPGGPNPDVAVPAALAAAGFTHIAEPLATWTYEDDHLAVVQPFLAGGAEGWALALASLRDLYAADCDPADAGGDFAAEACRLGEITARMHVAMAAAFGTSPPDRDAWLATMGRQLERVPDVDAAPLLGRLGDDLGCALRVHGDYHLGQVLRTDAGWFVLDFEGEPARPLEERTAPSSPWKDVAGMLRSFHYAAHVALAERDELEQAEVGRLAGAWEARNRTAFVEGYLAVPDVEPLVPASEEARSALLAAFELDKAVYEVLYERAHRPEWERIPRAAIARLLAG
ncbi:MAG TPA: hypothetical protein VHF47_11975 [Acidimicrobiales bacterium]|nr:hypothetical protein [Acidimicrobiales bacterium]